MYFLDIHRNGLDFAEFMNAGRVQNNSNMYKGASGPSTIGTDDAAHISFDHVRRRDYEDWMLELAVGDTVKVYSEVRLQCLSNQFIHG